MFNYQRTPANFDQVYNNMMKLNNNENINLKAWFALTVTPYNVFHLPEFMKWKLTTSGLTKFNPTKDYRPIVSHHMCHAPKHFNIKVLPANLKQQVVEHYQMYIDWINSTDMTDHVKKEFIKISNGVTKFMNSEDYSDQWLNEFITFTNKVDALRGQDIRTIVPQFKDMFDASK